MKHLKLYEDFDLDSLEWEWEEEDPDQEFQVGDRVVLKYRDRYRRTPYGNNSCTVFEWGESQDTMTHPQRVSKVSVINNEKVMMLDRKVPWYLQSEWRMVSMNESINFDEDDWDYIDEEEPQSIPLDMPEKFYIFLINYDCLDRWYKNYNIGWYKNISFKEFFNKYKDNEDLYIRSGFDWSQEGIDGIGYWGGLNNKWNERVSIDESINFSDDDWEWEEEDPDVEMIGNEVFTKFLVDNNIYDKFIDSVRKCQHSGVVQKNGGRKLLTISDINNYINTIRGHKVYDIFNYLISYGCVNGRRDIGVDWNQINMEWNQLTKM